MNMKISFASKTIFWNRFVEPRSIDRTGRMAVVEASAKAMNPFATAIRGMLLLKHSSIDGYDLIPCMYASQSLWDV